MMPDREKVISQLETDYRDAEHRGWILVPISRRTVKDVLALLKEQEVIPILIREGKNKMYNDYRCPRCDQEIVYEQNYCSECGSVVKWE